MSDINVAELLDAPKSRRYAKRARGATDKLAKAIRSARDDMQKTLDSKQLTDEAKARRISDRRAELLDAVDSIEAKAEEHLDIARSGAPKTKIPRDPGEAALLESRKARAWSRAEKMLATGREPQDVARLFAEQGDRLGLAALQEELPLWMSSQIPGASEAKRRTTEELQVIREFEGPLLSDEDREKTLGVTEAKRAAADLKVNVGMVRREAENTYTLSGEDDEGSPVTYDLGTFGPREETMSSQGQGAWRASVLGEVLHGAQLREGDDE
jgi:hypothetical protein